MISFSRRLLAGAVGLTCMTATTSSSEVNGSFAIKQEHAKTQVQGAQVNTVFHGAKEVEQHNTEIPATTCFTTAKTTKATTSATSTTVTNTSTTVATTLAIETTTSAETQQEEYESSWNGEVLTPFAGVVYNTPSGYVESFYNLDMSGCLEGMGLDASIQCVRDDGVKTYDGYVMVASPDLYAYPKGAYIETTLGMGLVVDYCPSGRLDIAVNW